MLLGGLANSIFLRYDPSLPYASQQQYADVVVEQQVTLTQKQQQLSDIREREQEASDLDADNQLTATISVR